MLFPSYDWPKIVLQQFATVKYVSVVLCVPYSTVSITFYSVYSKNKKVIGQSSARHMHVKIHDLVMEFRLPTNMTDFPQYLWQISL